MKSGRSKDWKVKDTSYFQNIGKLMKSCGNMVFSTSFQRFNLIGNAYIFCSDSNSIIAPTLKLPKPTYTARYCPNAGKAYRMVHKHWKTITTNSSVLKRLIADRPRLAYKANNNLLKKLVRAKLKNKCPTEQTTPKPNHTHVTKLANFTHQVPRFAEWRSITQCTNKYCPLHDRLLHSSQIRSRTTRTYNTHGKSNCDTPYIVYLIQCKKCNRQICWTNLTITKDEIKQTPHTFW